MRCLPTIPRICTLPVVLTLWLYSAPGQVARPAVPRLPLDSANALRFGFERLLNTYTGTGDLDYRWSDESVSIVMRQQLRSRLVRVQGTPRQDQYDGDVRVSVPFSRSVSAVLTEESSVLGGSRGADLEAISQHRVLVGPMFRPVEEVRLQGLAGWELNTQQAIPDKGPAVGAGVDLSEISIEGVTLNGSASWLRSDLGQRRPEDGAARLRMLSEFRPGSGDSLTVAYGRQVRELYSPVASVSGPATTVLRRAEDVFELRNALWFLSAEGLSGSIEGGVAQRSINRAFRNEDAGAQSGLPLPNTIDQLFFDVLGRVHWRPVERLRAGVGAGLSTGEETHDIVASDDVPFSVVDAQRAQARRRSNRSERFFTTFSVQSDLTEDLDLRLEGSAGILRYDTPDTLNTDDRDEQRISTGLTVGYRLSRQVSLLASVEAGQSHLVYLSRFQSANNVRIRTLRFAPSVVWESPGRFRNALHAEVAASYTVYDYEDLISTVQSFSYRQAAWNDSLTVRLSGRLGLEFLGSLRLFERGILRWDEFRERPQRAFLELYLWPRLTYAPVRHLLVGVGFRSFRQERYLYDQNVRLYDGAVGSYGPTVSVQALIGRVVRVTMTGWREMQHVNGSRTRSLSNLTLSLETRL